ncbi:hypothetical protein BKA61DRAFT_637246 [Leptodontidium sp. MPI-SDFR-AT-0119]|nr:hypothetical protein BKA61DRAFT_637246 [Leptodontidium sp. MPI-SDFR-AT-0119]
MRISTIVKLRSTLIYCISRLNISPAFVFALARYYLPSGQGFRSIETGGEPVIEFWYFLPLRMQVRCTDQMNPFNYLHLPDRQADIRGHYIALYARYNKRLCSATLLVFDFIDGRWSKSAREPYHRIPLTAIQNSAMRWWGVFLDSLNDQLIKYERRLQEDHPPEVEAQLQKDISKALHSMAARLIRYCSELKSIATIVDSLTAHHRKIYPEDGFWQVATQLRSIKDFAEELEKKTQNILALLFNRIQLSNDRMIVSNGNAMQIIMRATQAEAIRSQQLAVEMRKDGLSVKTVSN